MSSVDQPESSAEARRGSRLWLGLGLLALALVGVLAVALLPRSGQPLPDAERSRLLEQAGLPDDFPIHPFARRMPQPRQGGFSYSVDEPVPLVLTWQRDSLVRGGYEVFNADLEGEDDYLQHWLYFTNRTGATGAIIIRPIGQGMMSSTEVKVLSRGDVRLIPPTLPPGLRTR
jgi:hypothetical protein